MELCTTRTFTTSFSLPSSSSSSNSLRSNTVIKPFQFQFKFKFNSFNLSSFTPHIQPSLSIHTSSPFTISASSSSSSVSLDSENDLLPAQLKVTETEESDSRVCSFYAAFFNFIFPFINADDIYVFSYVFIFIYTKILYYPFIDGTFTATFPGGKLCVSPSCITSILFHAFEFLCFQNNLVCL